MKEEHEPSALPSVVPISEIQKSISSFNPIIAEYLTDIGLPTENILSPINERKKIINALAEEISILPINERAKATYLTRFTVAVAVGLFDGALTYLWDETVRAMRRLVAKFDLTYFFAVVEDINPRNKGLSTDEDLDKVGDRDLLDACRRIGLLSDVDYKRLEHINYMRNHASSAHPNDNDIGGSEMVGWLSNCLKCAILASPDSSVIQLKVLLENIRTHSIPDSDCSTIGGDIAKLSEERVDNLLGTLFGMYVDPRLVATAKSNIARLAPYVWKVSSEDRKYQIGAKYGIYRKNAEVHRKDAADEFLKIVGGSTYKDEDSLAGELIDKLGILRSVHYGIDNFYNEYPHAKILADSLPSNGIIPRAARAMWVKVICICYVGNGLGYREGVDERALPYYEKHINLFSESEIIEFLHLFYDAEFTAPIVHPKCEKRARQLAKICHDRTDNINIKKVLKLIIDASQSTVHNVAITTAFKNAMQLTPKDK